MPPESIHIKQLSSDSKNFDLQLDQLLEWESDSTLKIDQLVSNGLLYTSNAADDLLCLDPGGRGIIKKKRI